MYPTGFKSAKYFPYFKKETCKLKRFLKSLGIAIAIKPCDRSVDAEVDFFYPDEVSSIVIVTPSPDSLPKLAAYLHEIGHIYDLLIIKDDTPVLRRRWASKSEQTASEYAFNMLKEYKLPTSAAQGQMTKWIKTYGVSSLNFVKDKK